MSHSSSVLRDSSTHNPNVSYDINLGTPTAHLPRAYAVHNSIGMGMPNDSPLYAHHQQLGALASPGLGFNDFDDMKVS